MQARCPLRFRACFASIRPGLWGRPHGRPGLVNEPQGLAAAPKGLEFAQLGGPFGLVPAVLPSTATYSNEQNSNGRLNNDGPPCT